MKIVRTVAELREARHGQIGFIPTMGALHEGHLDHVRRARTANEQVIVSLFVNPTQFGPAEDLSRYPRNEERDAELVAAEGADVLFAPTVEEMYRYRGTSVQVPDLTTRWEGAHRPGHFDGVATVVTKLLNIVGPCRAYFGWKDLQQCLVIDRLVKDLNIPVELVFGETVRELDGLAMSSRNAYLSPAERDLAPQLYQKLVDSAVRIRGGAGVRETLGSASRELSDVGFRPSYLAFVRLDDLSETEVPGPNTAIIAAAALGSTRLIDNIRLD